MKGKIVKLLIWPYYKLLCLFLGHRCYSTGRCSWALKEWLCDRCGDKYVSHAEFNMLISADKDSDRIFENSSCERKEKY